MVELVGNIPDDAVLQAQLDILYGQTPDITIKAHELPEESEPTVEKSGTLAEPVFNIGIPQAMGAVAAREYAKQAETARDAAILAGETAKEELNGIVASADDALDQKIAETGTLLDEKVATAAQRASEAASSAVAAAQKATAAEQAMQGAQAAQAQAEQSAQEAADSAASINPSVYMQKSVYDPGNEQQPLLPRNGDGSNVTASFTEAEQDADIASGEKLSVLFGKIKKRFSVVNKLVNGAVYPNLLDNSDFTNPVNQRGEANYNQQWRYCIDRWVLVGEYDVDTHNLVFQADKAIERFGLTLCYMRQGIVGLNIGDIVTLSVSVGGTVYSQTITLEVQMQQAYNKGAFYSTVEYYSGEPDIAWFGFGVTSGSITPEWVKIEKGSVATPYVAKGYGAELVECYRYFWISSMQVNIFKTTAGDYW